MEHEERRERTQALWDTRLEAFRASDQSVAQWCREQEIPAHQLRYRLQKESATLPSSQWVALPKASQPTNAGVSLQVGSIAVHVQSGFDPAVLAEVHNRRKDRVKILEWSPQGFWLHYFRLERGRLPWPDDCEDSIPLDLTWQDLRQLLEGTPLRPPDQRVVRVANHANPTTEID